ncbi:MAG TPA: trypsin-like serine protease [Thiobacillaceae bacterium]|nr:trypsin-like serine protease [Thiobacillaceae bacterium]
MSRNPARAAALSLFALMGLAGGRAEALVGGVVDTNVPTSPWAGVVSIVPAGGGIYSGVLLDPWHVLTAAHVVYGTRDSPGNVAVNLNFAGTLSSVITASRIAIHPSYTTGNTASDKQFAWNDDLAVITLSRAVPAGVPTYPLFAGIPGRNGASRDITLVGYGGYANGTTSTVTVASHAGVKRVGRNRVDDLLPDDEGSGVAELFLFDLDGLDAATNLMGGPTLGENIEAGYAGGDSGSPAFVFDQGVWKVAGIAAFNGKADNGTGSALQFGAIGGGMLVAPYADWIRAQLAPSASVLTVVVQPVPEPQTWGMLLAGLGLVGLATARRRATVR